MTDQDYERDRDPNEPTQAELSPIWRYGNHCVVPSAVVIYYLYQREHDEQWFLVVVGPCETFIEIEDGDDPQAVLMSLTREMLKWLHLLLEGV